MKREDFEQHELEEFEKKLKQLPKIEDRRQKNEIYLNIKKQLNEPQQEKNKKPWLFPAIASIAALVLIVVIAPTLINNPDQNMAIPSEDLERSGVNEEDALVPEAGIFMADEFMEEETVNYISAIRNTEISGTQRVVTIPYVDHNAMFIVPVSFITRGDEPIVTQIDRIINQHDSMIFGLGDSPLRGINFIEEGQDILVDIPKERLQVGTAEIEMLRLSIELMVASLGYDKAILTQDGNSPVEFGNYGQVSELYVQERSYGYFFYDTYNSHRFLVPASFIYYPFVEKAPDNLTLEEVLLEMQNTDYGIGYQAAIPEGVSFSVSDEEGQVTITFTDTVNAVSDFILFSMIEAMLLTARDFQFDFVEFKGLDLNQIGPYDVRNPVSTHISPNGGGY